LSYYENLKLLRCRFGDFHFAASLLPGFAATKIPRKAKPYLLKTCAVSGEKLGEWKAGDLRS